MSREIENDQNPVNSTRVSEGHKKLSRERLPEGWRTKQRGLPVAGISLPAGSVFSARTGSLVSDRRYAQKSSAEGSEDNSPRFE
jgi:hypothetical protein